MATTVCLPKLAVSMHEGALVEWLVRDGDVVTADTVIYRLETDKVENDVVAGVAGRIRLLAEAGETYPVGTPVAEIG